MYQRQTKAKRRKGNTGNEASGELYSFIFSLPTTDENKDYFLALQHMIEEMAHKAGGPVVLIAHSMGNMYTLYFLNQQPQAWKDRYIKAFISLGAPWGGVAKTLRVLASGKSRKLLGLLCASNCPCGIVKRKTKA